ncbi:MAG TPA: LLM class flavin-dependent oxidoreductase [Chakrabartia sp.]|jgi:alkanesulfonate monooxygenase SsuD/methylene tetrahydromethanopterin reductase-like flavin-dependent oxidoreductase (luciferase family)|nr:LLM class flavin-dependent oxidoreductase [Chakrabartia sp.]
MKFHYAESMTAIDNYLPLAKAAEELGYDGFLIPDSLIYPKASDTAYSYTEDGGRSFLENKAFVESFILAAAMVGATSRIEFTTNVVKLPVRPPLYSAKLATSLAALSHNRFNFGVGLSVWPEDYEVMGVPWDKRGKRMDECIAIVKGLGTGDYFEFHGEFFDLPPVKLNPVPTKPLPILVGGHSDQALKRAARHDGFLYAGGPPGEIWEVLGKLQEFRRAAGTEGKPYRIFASGVTDYSPESLTRHAEAGVTDMAVVFRNLYAVEEDTQPLSEKLDLMKAFADTVIAKA